jgi:hypothetical protein
MIGGTRWTWVVPVYILNGNFPDAFPADEDPVPIDGEPHLEHPRSSTTPISTTPTRKKSRMGLQIILVSLGEILTLLLLLTFTMGLAIMLFQEGMPIRNLMVRWRMLMKMKRSHGRNGIRQSQTHLNHSF